jgi:DNA-binding NarL/FixJ family response regulator
MTRILLLDDHTLFRAMLGRLLSTEPDLEIVAHCAGVNEALAAAERENPDLILLDYDLGNKETGLHFIRQVRQSGYKGKLFLITAGMPDAESVRALGMGVSGIFLKHSPPELLTEALHKVISGQTWIDERCVQALVRAIESEQSATRRDDLSERERQVLKGVFEGLSNKEIGANLSISEATVKSTLQQLFLKTGVRTRSQLVRVALEEYGTAWGIRN